VAKRNNQPPTPEELENARAAALYTQATLCRKVLNGLAADATGTDPVVRGQSQKLFLESWLSAMDRNELRASTDRLVELMEEQRERQQRDPLP
jgi:hypothetical protein